MPKKLQHRKIRRHKLTAEKAVAATRTYNKSYNQTGNLRPRRKELHQHLTQKQKHRSDGSDDEVSA
jgi:hypothetical protein